MHTNRFISFIVIFFAFSAIALAQKVVELQYPTYSVIVFSQLRSEDEMKDAPFLTARQRTVKGKELRPFGILLREKGKSSDMQTVLEIIDAEKNVSIKKVSLAEYFGKETASWQTIGAESKTSPQKIVSVFRIQSGVYNFKLIRELAITEDRNLPLGKKINMAFSMESKNPLKLRVKFYGLAEGTWKSLGNSLLISDLDTVSRIHSTLVFHPLQESTIDVARPSKKGDAPRFIVTTKVTSLPTNTPTIVFTIEVAGTSILFDGYIVRQAENIQTYFNTHIGKPAIVTVTQASKASSHPGDTLLFLLYSHNIGTAPAIENTLNNIIPAGTLYLEGTAEGKGSDITYTRRQAAPPQMNPVTNITWKYQDPIYSGEERIASFKVVVQ